MTIGSGAVSLNAVNTELGRSATTLLSMNEQAVRDLAQVGGSGSAWGLVSLRGKSSYIFMYGAQVSNFSYDSNGGSGTQYTLNCTPSVSGVQGGSGGYTYNWQVTAGAQPNTGSTFNGPNPVFKYTIGKYGSEWHITLRCNVTDNTGHTLNIDGIAIDVYNTPI